MSLTPPSPARRTVSTTVFIVGLLVAGGFAVAGTSIYYDLRPAAAAAPPGSLSITDDLGRHVNVPYDPSRVVVLGPSIMDTMVRLGLRSHVVGVDCSTPAFGGLSGDYSPGQIANWSLTASMCVQAEPLSFEQLVNASPALVLAATIVSQQDVDKVTDTYGIPVVMIQPPNLDGIEVDVGLIGTIFGVGAAAEALNEQLASELNVTSTYVSNLTTAFPTVLVTYSTDSSGYWTYGRGTFGASLMLLAGGASISENESNPYPELSGEQVLVDNPQVIIYGTGFGLDLASYSTAPFWSSLGAVEDGHVYGLDSNDLTEPDATMILIGLPALLAQLHPGGP